MNIKPANNSSPETRFQYAVNVVLEHEGGLTNDKRDPGGITQWGISLRFLRTIGLDINHDGTINAEDVLAIDKPHAKEIYRHYWWDYHQYNAIASIDVAAKVFDLAVNMGSYEANRILQTSINQLQKQQIEVDGIIGSETLIAVNGLLGSSVREEMRHNAEHVYIQIILKNPSMAIFKNGWMNRAAW